MDTTELAERIFLHLPYTPTDQQVEVLAALAKFCSPDMPSDSAFLLAGYAGTGKTSLMGALVKALKEINMPAVLLAPTGRAAKVFGRFAGTFASTIHRRIYRPPAPGDSIGFVSVADNTMRDTVFIVDEASMIADNGTEGRTSLLEDLVYYVYSGEGCR
ncbi:MAG: AAA family ATPase, partial [Paramuribaculum sp.]|nr:AAA family ATPase [Paramuribaculum sp.]